MQEARLYDKLDSQAVQCRLCAHRCTIQPGRRGVCGVRENRAGTLHSLIYGELIARAIDPIEKKPLFHFHPGSSAFSIASAGCNLRCSFCQNAEISQMPRDLQSIEGHRLAPEAIVAAAGHYGCRSIAYTYTEPAIAFEYVYDVSLLARRERVANIFVTNGYMTPEMLEAYHPYLDAANVDLKSFRDEFYRRLCDARLQPVLDALTLMRRQGIWLEVTTLIIPGHNDDPAELADLAGFIARELGVGTPWHISRFHPAYRLTDAPPTPAATLQRAHDIGREAGLRYVYIGNLPGLRGEDTSCPGCGRTVIGRYGFAVTERHLKDGACAYCGTKIDGVGL
ncbi:MAG TPA: AmmeMemoRadiSam system radical SAM enzyme [Anaerolineae bacterium]|nr:AmmeMemoRadiSam system radical SAM enzyme [Anaerolineae bacterium]HPL28076.1 AmmeMemoRadiSam system radical SAM enzyme [Anaerolineae bacterium]